MKRTGVASSADRAARAETHQLRGQAELAKPANVFGTCPVDNARVEFDRAVALQPQRALGIGDFLLRHGEIREAIRYRKMLYVRMPANAPARAPVATTIGDAYLQASHESRLCYKDRYNQAARRYYNQAIAADSTYYPAHLGRYGALIDDYRHGCRKHFWRHHAKGDVYVYEQALKEWATVLNQAPQAVLKEWLREPSDLFVLKATPRTMPIYRDVVVPALGGVLIKGDADRLGADEELTRLALIACYRMLQAEPWTLHPMAYYLYRATETAGLTSKNLPELLRIYDRIAHDPVPQGPALVDASRRLRKRFVDDSGAMLQLVALQKMMLDAYSQRDELVGASLRELSKLARGNSAVAFDALTLMLTCVAINVKMAPVALHRAAKAAAAIADTNVADSDVLVFHLIDQLRVLSNHPNAAVSHAAANALQGPLRKYYDSYRAAEEDARRERDQGDSDPADAVPGGAVPPPDVTPPPDVPPPPTALSAPAVKPRKAVTFAPRPR